MHEIRLAHVLLVYVLGLVLDLGRSHTRTVHLRSLLVASVASGERSDPVLDVERLNATIVPSLHLLESPLSLVSRLDIHSIRSRPNFIRRNVSGLKLVLNSGNLVFSGIWEVPDQSARRLHVLV